MESKINKTSVVSSLLWKFMERGGTQGIQFIVQIVLARLLLPSEYGVIAIIMVFISLAGVFVQSGFNTALIQKKGADELDFSSVFYLSLAVAFVLYGLIFFSAPYISKFYGQPQLTPTLRVLSVTLFIGAFNSIQNAFVARNMLFKKLFWSSMGAVIISGIVGIFAAYSGLGVWALVAQQITSQLSVAVILWFTVKWRPQLIFSLERLKKLFHYGSKLLASGLIDTLYNNMRTLLIGRIYSPSVLGFYHRGQAFPSLIESNINGSIGSVMLPTLSAHQHDKKRVKEITRRAIVTSSFLVFPMMIGMAAVAEPLIKLLLTEKWIQAVPFLQIFCISFALWPIHTANLQAINALGRSDIFLKLEIIKKIMGITLILISIPFGVYAIAIGEVVTSIVASFINASPNKQLLGYSFKEQLIDIVPSFLLSVIMGAVVYFIRLLPLDTPQLLALQIAVGSIVYFGLARLFKLESAAYLVTTMKQVLKARKAT